MQLHLLHEDNFFKWDIILKKNSRLSLALHTLAHMANAPDKIRTSADIAEHAGTNPVVVRRVLGHLRQAGLLASEKGHAGGWRLARSPDEITLADVYLALDESLISSSDEVKSHNCSLERALHNRVANIMSEIEQSLLDRLKATTIVEICE